MLTKDIWSLHHSGSSSCNVLTYCRFSMYFCGYIPLYVIVTGDRCMRRVMLILHMYTVAPKIIWTLANFAIIITTDRNSFIMHHIMCYWYLSNTTMPIFTLVCFTTSYITKCNLTRPKIIWTPLAGTFIYLNLHVWNVWKEK